ncbi:CPBP family intramembrane glutamic endopeptidase [Ureibacillus manganicus]|uniref:CAAX protease n=1 Tax=Ureibacillus manganicus DSM 26584 TaxID=1384049 RepID=A0A0A3IAL9_9BACL|nr:CPBP family intramembrane glutamic endopeptidase [Ureibacillus manganicus]KGR80530.1 CAAX protease [Ureibacillus manganicus DSM 26584]
MKKHKKLILLLLSLVFFYAVIYYSFEESEIFWYLYPFIILIGVAISFLSAEQKDELSIWKCLIYGIGYGVILYGITRLFYTILKLVSNEFSISITKYISTFGPSNIWHYLLLIFIIIVGEEIFWRGFIQETIKSWTSPLLSIVLTSLLFAGPFILSGYFSYGLLTFIVGLLLGLIYEWKKSIPLTIVAHEVYILLLFLLIPFF